MPSEGFDFSKLFIDVSLFPHDGYGAAQLLMITSVYGWLLYSGANYISDGSEMLLLVPALKYVVGSVVLPVLGAVPDGAIIAFSGAGSHPQHSINIGMGALAGSTIMLLCLPWFLAVLGGRVSIIKGRCTYTYPHQHLLQTLSKASEGMCEWPSKPVLLEASDLMRKQGHQDMVWPRERSDTISVEKLGKQVLVAIQKDKTTFQKLRDDKCGLFDSGVEISDDVRSNAKIMLLSSLGLVIVQLPSMINQKWIVSSEKESMYVALALGYSVLAFCGYLWFQFRNSDNIQRRIHRKRMQAIVDGEVSIGGAFFELLEIYDNARTRSKKNLLYKHKSSGVWETMCNTFNGWCNDEADAETVMQEMRAVLKPFFNHFDADKSGWLEEKEVINLLNVLGEDGTLASQFIEQFDTNRDGRLGFDDFSKAMHDEIRRKYADCVIARELIEEDDQILRDVKEDLSDVVDSSRVRKVLRKRSQRLLTQNKGSPQADVALELQLDSPDKRGKLSLKKQPSYGSVRVEDKKGNSSTTSMDGGDYDPLDEFEDEAVDVLSDSDSDEDEELPEDLTRMTDAQRQTALKRRSYGMMLIGLILVMVFSDPMVDVFGEIGERVGVPPFYVSFVLAPMVSNASELIASYNYASKRTRITMSSALSALEGAGVMNNTFCTGVFLYLIWALNLQWEFPAETIALLFVECAVALMVLSRDVMRLFDALVVMMFYPLSLFLIWLIQHSAHKES
eukprot:g5269.t1